MSGQIRTTMTVNGEAIARSVEPRQTLADFLRDELGLTGTHIGCEHGVCGACTVIVNGASIRSCISYAVQFEGAEIRTIESVVGEGSQMHPVLDAMRECHGLQCGFCTSGIVMTILELLGEVQNPSEEEARDALSGHLCRCTGYETIVDAVLLADRNWRRQVPGPDLEVQE